MRKRFKRPRCYICKKRKDKSDFYKSKNAYWGVTSRCKSCQKKWDKEYQKTKTRVLYCKNYNKEYYSKHYNREKVRWIIKEALKRKRIKKLPCKICGKKKSQAHHSDYTKPLKVIWFCRKHHLEWHRNNKYKE